MSIRAYLYDAAQPDREIRVTPESIAALHDQQLLWVDIADYTEREIQDIGALFGLTPASIADLLHPERRPRLRPHLPRARARTMPAWSPRKAP